MDGEGTKHLIKHGLRSLTDALEVPLSSRCGERAHSTGLGHTGDERTKKQLARVPRIMHFMIIFINVCDLYKNFEVIYQFSSFFFLLAVFARGSAPKTLARGLRPLDPLKRTNRKKQ